MTHEFKKIVEEALLAKKNNTQSVLASVVALDGSSYRRPGVRMLVLENGKMVGAVSGGCVEKEILRQAESVFKTGESKIMTYDGRYRLGCEGVLYILLESFIPIDAFFDTFYKCLESRQTFEIQSFYTKNVGTSKLIGTAVKIDDEQFSLKGKDLIQKSSLSVFKQSMPPCFKLVIVGAEHDAVQLCQYAALTGWEVVIVSGPSEVKSIQNFPGANEFLITSAETMRISLIDNETAIVLMTHNFANDLRYLVALKETNPAYIGLLGPTKRREDILSQFIEFCPEARNEFLDTIYGPAGINIGSETPQEIAISILAEILAVTRNKELMPLRIMSGRIHAEE